VSGERKLLASTSAEHLARPKEPSTRPKNLSHGHVRISTLPSSGPAEFIGHLHGREIRSARKKRFEQGQAASQRLSGRLPRKVFSGEIAHARELTLPRLEESLVEGHSEWGHITELGYAW